MPLSLVPPRPGRSKNFRIRGTYLGCYLDRSAGTAERGVAKRKLKTLKEAIELGDFSTPAGGRFVDAVAAYLRGGGEARYLQALLDYFGNTALEKIDQAAIDRAAGLILPPGITAAPSAQNANVNRQIHTPMSSILKAGGRDLRIRRPKQPPGRTRWIEPGEAAALIRKAPARLRRLIVFLLYTGCRITETCRLEWPHVSLEKQVAYIAKTKNGDARAVHLPAVVIDELQAVPKTGRKGRVFGYRDRWEVYEDWTPALKAAGLADFTPHDCCHTWATWMRRYAGQDLRGLLGTGRWKDIKSVLRYQHVDTTEESKKADLLPRVVQNPWSGDDTDEKSTA